MAYKKTKGNKNVTQIKNHKIFDSTVPKSMEFIGLWKIII